MKKQTATYNPGHKPKFTTAHRKENPARLDQEFAVLVPSEHSRDELHAVVILRTYCTSTGGSNTACLWVNAGDVHTSGSGSAGGYGYHRPSAAAHEAIHNAGFTLARPIDGVGNDAIREAVLAIARGLGFKNARLHVAHA